LGIDLSGIVSRERLPSPSQFVHIPFGSGKINLTLRDFRGQSVPGLRKLTFPVVSFAQLLQIGGRTRQPTFEVLMVGLELELLVQQVVLMLLEAHP
jgi:hypothetical protein